MFTPDTPLTYCEILSRTTKRYPDSVAIETRDERLTYTELTEQVVHRARCLAAAGVRRGDIVGICLPRGAEMVVSQLAVMHAGAAYLPLDPSYPAERLAYMVRDSRTMTVLVNAETESRILTNVRRLDVDALPKAEAEPERPEVHDLAYVIYTSGSTGRPKGVMVTHAGFTTMIDAQQRHMLVNAASRVLQFASPSFDASVFEMSMALGTGACLVIPHREGMVGDSLVTTLKHARITHATLPPAVLPGLSPENLDDLECLTVAGEACPGPIVDIWSRGRRMVNAYGPTETTVWATASGALSGAGTPPIGTALEGTRVLVLDDELRPVGPGGTGELYISGPGLARGYHNRPALTASRFVAEPGGAPGSRMYRTGDVAQVLPDGQLEFRGRSDDQVKLRGFRIELGEIESALLDIPGIGQAAALVRDDGAVRRLVAYAVPEQGASLPPSEDILARLATDLPAHMVPAVVVTLPEIPLTPNGKVDRKALPSPEDVAPQLEYVAPRNEVEETVAAVFAELLGVERAGMDADFFQLGGDSILAVRLVSRLERLFDVVLGRRSVFTNRTPAALARTVAEASTAHALRRVDRGAPLPLSAAQRRMWFLYQHDRMSAEYYTGAAYRLDGPLSVEALGRALSAVQSRHEALRTCYANSDDGPVQIIAEPSAGASLLRTVDLRTPSEAGRDEDLRLALTEEVERPFDLQHGSPFRALLVHLDEDQHILVLSAHHIACDGWSLDIVIHDLGCAYACGATAAVDADRSAARIDYADYAVWDGGRWTAEVLEKRRAFWRSELEDLPPLGIPTDRPRPAVRSHAGSVLRVDLGRETTDLLTIAARRHGMTLFTLLATATHLALAAASGSCDVAVGVASAGRDHHDLDDVVGFFVNPVVVRSAIEYDDSLGKLLTKTDARIRRALDNELPFELVVEAVRPDRDPSRSPIVQALMVLQNAHTGKLKLPGLEVSSLPLPRTSALFDVVLEFAVDDGSLHLSVEYSTALYTRSRMNELVESLRACAIALAESPRLRVHDLDLLPPKELARLDRWEGRDATTPQRSVVDVLLEQASRRPDAVALDGPGGTATYAELVRRAATLSNRILGAGATQEQPVLIIMERGNDVIIAMAAILMAGCAYVPIHPDDPEERVQRIAAEAGAALAVADASSACRIPEGVTALSTDTGADAAEVDTSLVLHRSDRPGSLAYVMFTSGSTGRPKGVCVDQQSIVRLAEDSRWQGHDRVLFHSSHAFDAVTYEIWVPLLNGGTVVVAGPERLDAGGFGAVVRGYDVTSAFLTSALFNLYATQDATCFTSLRHLMTGGEAANPASFNAVRRLCPDTLVSNIYGPTETTTFATMQPLPGCDPVPAVVPIGVPLDGVVARVLDGALRRVPVGCVGELYLGGAGVARGYLGRAGLTAERFVADPFAGGSRLYRTGDLVRWDREGRLEFVGRADSQVKLRGFRIELGEIEAALRDLPDVALAVVSVLRQPSGGKALVAHVTLDTGSEADTQKMRDALSAILPGYMVPTAIVIVPALPLNPNGKVDRRALPAPDWDSAAQSGFEEPRTPTEELVAEIFSQILHRKRVGRHDNFFDIGGDSVKSIQVAGEIHRALDLSIPTRTLFDAQTVQAYAQAVEDHLSKGL